MITNKELEILIKMENLIGVKSKKIFGKDYDKKVKINYENGEEVIIILEDISDFICIIERIIKNKKVKVEKQNKFNKKHAEYHRITNNISNSKKSGNKEKLKYWEKKLEEYKKSKKEE